MGQNIFVKFTVLNLIIIWLSVIEFIRACSGRYSVLRHISCAWILPYFVDCRLVVVMQWDCRPRTAALGLLNSTSLFQLRSRMDLCQLVHPPDAPAYEAIIHRITMVRQRWYRSLPPNVVVGWLTLLLRNQEVPGSNLGPKTGCPDWGFLWFFSVPPRDFRNIILNWNMAASFQILSISSFTYHPFIRLHVE
jgi:hypothetical protein